MVNLKREPPLSFTTNRLNIRRYTRQDEQRLFNAARESISEIYPFLPWCHPEYSIEESRGWLRTVTPSWQDQQAYSFLIEHSETGEFLGGIGLNHIPEHPVYNLGYWIKSSAAGKGFATEATRGLVNYGFKYLSLMRIEILMSVLNPASRKVAINSGAQYEGRLRNRLNIHGENHDVFLYSLIPEDLITSNYPPET